MAAVNITVYSEEFFRGNIRIFESNIRKTERDLAFLREMGSAAYEPMLELYHPQIEKNKRYIELNQVKLKTLLN